MNTFEKFISFKCRSYILLLFSLTVLLLAELSDFVKYLAAIFSTKNDSKPKRQYTTAIDILAGLGSIVFIFKN